MKSIQSMISVVVTTAALLTSLTASAIEVRFEQDQSIPMVYLNVAIKAGAAHDPDNQFGNQFGVTNFMGQMLLRGTKNKTKEQIDLALDQIGAHLDVETRSEALILRGATLSNKLPDFLEIVGELITESNFPQSEINKVKREIVSNIMEERGKDGGLARTKWDQFLFAGHPYGHPIKGTIPSVEKITKAEIITQYGRFFQDQYMLVVGSGDSDASFIDAWAKRIAEKRPNAAITDSRYQPIAVVAEPKAYDKRRVQIIDKPDRTQTQVFLGHKGVRMTDADFFPLFLGNHAFGGGSFSAKLMVEIRVKRGWSYSAYSYFKHGLRPRSWQAFYFPATKDTPDALSLGIKLIEELKEKGITETEYELAKMSLVNSAGFMFNTPKKRVENILLERTLDLPDGFMRSYGPALAKVSRSQVNASFKKFLKPESLSILVLATAKDTKAKIAKATGVDEKDVSVVSFNKD